MQKGVTPDGQINHGGDARAPKHRAVNWPMGGRLWLLRMRWARGLLMSWECSVSRFASSSSSALCPTPTHRPRTVASYVAQRSVMRSSTSTHEVYSVCKRRRSTNSGTRDERGGVRATFREERATSRWSIHNCQRVQKAFCTTVATGYRHRNRGGSRRAARKDRPSRRSSGRRRAPRSRPRRRSARSGTCRARRAPAPSSPRAPPR